MPQFVRDGIIHETSVLRYHYESLLDHLKMTTETTIRLADKFDMPTVCAELIGSLHDIGKPFAKRSVQHKNGSNIIVYTGHAQIGTYLISCMNLEPKLKQQLMWATEYYMCCCSHQADLIILKQFQYLLNLTLPEHEQQACIKLLALLFVADQISRVGDDAVDEEKCINYANAFLKKMQYIDMTSSVREICNFKKCMNDKIVIFPLGLSGYGKSHFSIDFKHTFPNTVIVERDSCYVDVARQLGFDGDYRAIYKFIIERDNGKTLVQELFVKKICDALEDTSIKIIIIDTMQTLFDCVWKQVIESMTEEARNAYALALKIGVYLFP